MDNFCFISRNRHCPAELIHSKVLDIDEYLVEEGDQVILSSPDKYIINSKFKFEWCRNGYKICPLEPLFGEDLVLSVSLNDNGTGNVTVEKDSIINYKMIWILNIEVKRCNNECFYVKYEN